MPSARAGSAQPPLYRWSTQQTRWDQQDRALQTRCPTLPRSSAGLHTNAHPAHTLVLWVQCPQSAPSSQAGSQHGEKHTLQLLQAQRATHRRRRRQLIWIQRAQWRVLQRHSSARVCCRRRMPGRLRYRRAHACRAGALDGSLVDSRLCYVRRASRGLRWRQATYPRVLATSPCQLLAGGLSTLSDL